MKRGGGVMTNSKMNTIPKNDEMTSSSSEPPCSVDSFWVCPKFSTLWEEAERGTRCCQ